MTLVIPEGFGPIFRTSPLLDTLGPFYSQGMGAALKVGAYVQAHVLNNRNTVHAAFIAAMADVALGYATATSQEPPAMLVTANLTIDFAGSAKEGDWIESRVDIQKVGKSMAYANVYLSVNEKRIVRASAVFSNSAH
jgi:acyl-coenzyme A thioesterase PaaI-like protein